MIKYSFSKSSIKGYAKAFSLFKTRIGLIVMGGAFPLMIYFFIIGFAFDNEALLYAYPLSAVFCCLGFLNMIVYIYIKKYFKNYLNETSHNGIINYTFSKNYEIFELICLNNGGKFNFKFSDITKLKKFKKHIVLQFNFKKSLVLPNIKEIETLLF